MAVAPPATNLVDTTKVDNLENGIDAIISAPGWFAANVKIDGAGNPYWEGTSNSTYLNMIERVVLRDRYLAAGWRVVQVEDPDGTKTKTLVRVFI